MPYLRRNYNERGNGRTLGEKTRKMKMLTVKQMADALQVTRPRIHMMRQEGKLQGEKIGRDWFFNESQIDGWVKIRCKTKFRLKKVK